MIGNEIEVSASPASWIRQYYIYQYLLLLIPGDCESSLLETLCFVLVTTVYLDTGYVFRDEFEVV